MPRRAARVCARILGCARAFFVSTLSMVSLLAFAISSCSPPVPRPTITPRLGPGSQFPPPQCPPWCMRARARAHLCITKSRSARAFGGASAGALRPLLPLPVYVARLRQPTWGRVSWGGAMRFGAYVCKRPTHVRTNTQLVQVSRVVLTKHTSTHTGQTLQTIHQNKQRTKPSNNSTRAQCVTHHSPTRANA